MIAYLDIAPSPFVILDTTVRGAPPRTVETMLTTIESDVITVSLRDPVWSLGPSGRVRRAPHWIFDVRRPSPLADARLEALRRFAVLVRRFGDRPNSAETDRRCQSDGEFSIDTRRVKSAVGLGPDRCPKGIAARLCLREAAQRRLADESTGVLLSNGFSGQRSPPWHRWQSIDHLALETNDDVSVPSPICSRRGPPITRRLVGRT